MNAKNMWSFPSDKKFMDENHKDEIGVIGSMGKRISELETMLSEALDLLAESALPFAVRESRDHRFKTQIFLGRFRSGNEPIEQYPDLKHIILAVEEVIGEKLTSSTNIINRERELVRARKVVCALAKESDSAVGSSIARSRTIVLKNRRKLHDDMKYDPDFVELLETVKAKLKI